ncbi:MAG: hypothetical protein IJ113_00980 [Eggerthellaceae bacterium]|nr:hypothetical protein [Eggerthellaceae bacterium]
MSEQIKELRSLADHLDETERGMGEYVQAMREAADTIESLRDRLQAELTYIERMEKLESLCIDLWRWGWGNAPVTDSQAIELARRMVELGLIGDSDD